MTIEANAVLDVVIATGLLFTHLFPFWGTAIAIVLAFYIIRRVMAMIPKGTWQIWRKK